MTLLGKILSFLLYEISDPLALTAFGPLCCSYHVMTLYCASKTEQTCNGKILSIYQFLVNERLNSSLYPILSAHLRICPINIVTFLSGQCQNDNTGDEIAQGTIRWTTQVGDTTQTRICPYGCNDLKPVNASRFCKCDEPTACKNPFWLEPNMTGCKFNDGGSVLNNSITLKLSAIAKVMEYDHVKNIMTRYSLNPRPLLGR